MPSGETIRSGFFSALDPLSGDILWQTRGTPASSVNMAAVTVANGVVYAGTVDAPGTMYALDAATGATLWSFQSGGSVNAGAAVVNGVVYWGSGYGVPGFGISGNNKLYAFEVQDGALLAANGGAVVARLRRFCVERSRRSQTTG